MNNNTNGLKYKIIPPGLAKDIRGNRYNRLTVLERVEAEQAGPMWVAQCECGNKTIAGGRDMKSGNTKSCGCLHRETATKLGKAAFRDLKNKRFGKLVAIKPTDRRSGSSVVWMCKCDCGETTYVSANHLNSDRTKSCGCSHLKNSGEGHYNWNPELTDDDRDTRNRQSNQTKNWRNKVYKRDNYTCKVCGVVGGKLNAHHLNGWDLHKDERFDVNNGVTLCRKDHTTFHKEYGYGNNTKEQFFQYFLNKTQKSKVSLR